MRMRTSIVVVVVLLAACTFDASAPPNAVITCAGDADCPNGEVCNGFTQRCGAKAAIDAPPPSIVDGPTLDPTTGDLDTTFSLAVTFDGPLDGDPDVAATIGGVQRFWIVDEELTDRDAQSYVFEFSPDTSDVEGEWPVDVAWASPAGVPATPARAGTITLDYGRGGGGDVPASIITGPTLEPSSGGLADVFVVDVAYDAPLGDDPACVATIGAATRPFAIEEANTDRAAATYRFTYVGSSRVDLQACKLEYSIVSPK